MDLLPTPTVYSEGAIGIHVKAVGPRLICDCLCASLRPLTGIRTAAIVRESISEVRNSDTVIPCVLLLVAVGQDTNAVLTDVTSTKGKRSRICTTSLLPPIVLVTNKNGMASAYKGLLKDSTRHLIALDLESDTPRLHQAVLEAAGSAGRSAQKIAEPSGLSELLSGRQREVATLAAAGLSNAEIGERLQIDITTVKTHLCEAYRKMGVQRRSQIAMRLSSPFIQ